MPRRAVRVLAAKRAPALLLRADGAMPPSVPPRVVIATASGPAGEAATLARHVHGGGGDADA